MELLNGKEAGQIMENYEENTLQTLPWFEALGFQIEFFHMSTFSRIYSKNNIWLESYYGQMNN